MSLTTTRLYRSDDPGAPVLNGTAGSFIDVLRACLVGVSGVAYGTGANEKAPAGWTEEFTGTNKAVYRNSLAAGGTGCYLRVDDTGSLGGGALNAFFKVYGSMSDVDTGSDMVPDATASPDGEYLRKSTTANSTARPWIVVADERTVYVNVLPANADFAGGVNNADGIGWFGDFDSHVPADSFAYGIAARPGKTPTDMTNSGTSLIFPSNDGYTAGGLTSSFITSSWLAGGLDGLSGAVTASIHTPANSTSNFGQLIGGTGAIPNPAPGSAREYFIPAFLVHDSTIRGRLRGCFVPLNDMTAVQSGTVRSNIEGMPEDASLIVFRASCAASLNSARTGALTFDVGAAW